MRVLHVIPSIAASDGGPSRAMRVIERALTQAGATVVTLTTDHQQSRRGPLTEEFSCAGNKITRVYVRKLANFYKVAPGMLPWLWHNVCSFDVVHIHALFSFSSIAASLVALVRGVPFIIRPLGTLTRYGMQQRPALKSLSFTLVEGPLLRRAAAVHFTSHEEWNEARGLNIAIQGTVIPLGVEETGCGSAARIEEVCPILKDRLAVLFLSRLDPKKNVEALLDAFATCLTGSAAPILIIAGAGSRAYTENLQDRVRKLNLRDRVLWLGHVDGEAKDDVLARADVFVLPSYSENFGIAAVEAMLAGLPCVLGEGVAVAKKAAADGAAMAVAPNAAAIAEAMTSLLRDENLRHQMGQKARAHARRNYSEKAMAAALKELYVNVSALSK
jgi:glycosyltransferase involved in cell wall biosynthesis